MQSEKRKALKKVPFRSPSYETKLAVYLTRSLARSLLKLPSSCCCSCDCHLENNGRGKKNFFFSFFRITFFDLIDNPRRWKREGEREEEKEWSEWQQRRLKSIFFLFSFPDRSHSSKIRFVFLSFSSLAKRENGILKQRSIERGKKSSYVARSIKSNICCLPQSLPSSPPLFLSFFPFPGHFPNRERRKKGSTELSAERQILASFDLACFLSCFLPSFRQWKYSSFSSSSLNLFCFFLFPLFSLSAVHTVLWRFRCVSLLFSSKMDFFAPLSLFFHSLSLFFFSLTLFSLILSLYFLLSFSSF